MNKNKIKKGENMRREWNKELIEVNSVKQNSSSHIEKIE